MSVNSEYLENELRKIGAWDAFRKCKEIEALKDILSEDEPIWAISKAAYENNLGTLVISPRRIIFLRKTITSKIITNEILIEKIDSVGPVKGMLTGSIDIYISGKKQKITNITTNATNIKDAIEHGMRKEEYTPPQPKSEPLTIPPSPQTQKKSSQKSKKKWLIVATIILFSFAALVSLIPDAPEDGTEKAQETVSASTKQNKAKVKPPKDYELLAITNADTSTYSRRAVKITVPFGLTKEQLTEVMTYVAQKVKKDEKVDRVWVHAYHDKTEDYSVVTAATIDIDDKGYGSGEVNFAPFYLSNPEEYTVKRLPENKRKEYYSKRIMIGRTFPDDTSGGREKAIESLNEEYGISEEEETHILFEADIMGWKGPNEEKYAKDGYYCIPKEEVGKEWYQCGTLHASSSDEWLEASHQNRIATCADYLFKLYKDGALNINLPSSLYEIKQYAEEMALAMDEVFRSSEEKLSVPQTAALLMVQAGWLN